MFRALEAKKLVSVSATSTSTTDAREKVLERISYIHYPVRFKKDMGKTPVQALINSESEVNAIHPSFTKQLGLSITAKSNDLSRSKGHWIYGLGNLDTYCIKRKEIKSYLENKYYGR